MLYQAAYRVDKNGGGTLSSGSDSGKTALTYDVTSAAQTVSVTAVPQEGHVFVRWATASPRRPAQTPISSRMWM